MEAGAHCHYPVSQEPKKRSKFKVHSLLNVHCFDDIVEVEKKNLSSQTMVRDHLYRAQYHPPHIWPLDKEKLLYSTEEMPHKPGTRGLLFEASPGKKFARPYFNQELCVVVCTCHPKVQGRLRLREPWF
jgi:hypothetical protein